MKRISVVILNWNGREMMRRFLPSVVKYSRDEADVIVADNASTDGSLDMLAREFPEVGTLRLDRNYGFAEGYNRALAQLPTEFYLLLNSDVEVTEGWLTPLLRYMDAHPEVAACQPKLLCEARRDMFEYAGAAGGYLDRFGYPYCRGRVMDTVECDRGQYDRPASVFWATGAALMVRRSDWDAAGGLDARFFAHMEEVDFCWRLRARGRGVVCLPESRVYHVGGGTLNKSNARKTYLNFRNNLLMLYKNLPDEELAAVMRVRRLRGPRQVRPDRPYGRRPRRPAGTQGVRVDLSRLRRRPAREPAPRRGRSHPRAGARQPAVGLLRPRAAHVRPARAQPQIPAVVTRNPVRLTENPVAAMGNPVSRPVRSVSRRV